MVSSILESIGGYLVERHYHTFKMVKKVVVRAI